ncbi:MAG TPA: Rieske (2Fe-2S) protein [Gaiellaceae bacterium]|nr:Rieske (2Fe-2S) protein [Gaiellaceae bacterium]
MSAWHDVGSVADLERDGHVVARVGGREVGVVRVDGELRGVRNRCPHHGGPLCLGTVRERVAGEPGRYMLAGTPVLRCPWHGWEFDPASGRCLDDEAMRVAVYPAKAEDGRILVQA